VQDFSSTKYFSQYAGVGFEPMTIMFCWRLVFIQPENQLRIRCTSCSVGLIVVLITDCPGFKPHTGHLTKKLRKNLAPRPKLNHQCNRINNVVLDEARLCYALTNSKVRHLLGLKLSFLKEYLNHVEEHLSEARSRYTRSPFALSSMDSNTMFDTLFF